ncbi:hypothetical protein SK128_014254 [Halocaridina rubra]|uniref:Uncharacterized protein n=1 Tax=Halocaridina rubra TaxID=373956 RepID=A0AAN8XR52_HALRR
MTGLQEHFYKVVFLQEKLVGHLCFATTLSYLTLVYQMLKQIGSSLSVAFIQRIMGKDSPLRVLRLSPHRRIWQATLAVNHAILSLKNVPLLQEAYNYILADLQVAHQMLVPQAEKFTTSSVLEGVSYDEQEAIVILMYYMTVLAEVANTRNSIITMWALTPSLVDLLATHLTPTSAHLALHYPEVQYAILFLLYSHCTKHSHYASSSTLIVGASAPFVPPTVSSSFSGGSPGGFSSGSSTSENLGTILCTLTSVLKQRQVIGTNVMKLCLDWAADVVRSSETSLPQLVKNDVFTDVIDAVIQTGYHLQNSVTSSVANCLSKIFAILPPNQIQNLDEIVKLSLHHVSNNNEKICSVFLDLLSRLPLSSVSHAMRTANSHDENEYSGNKGDGSSNVQFGKLDSTSDKSLERHFVTHSIGGHLPSNAFHTLMSFILHVAQPKGEYWQEDLYAISQRIEKMGKVEDCSLRVLASHLRYLLWKWLAWEPAQHCIANKLRTTLGKPQDTFTSIESAIKSRAKEVKECGVGLHKQSANTSTDDQHTSKSLNGSEKSSKQNGNVKVHSLAVMLLVEFLENLEKAMFNASESCTMAVPQIKSVRAFFRTNRQTCTEWLSRIRAAVIVVALNSGRPEVAIRHSYKLLQELKDNNNTQSCDFERAVCYCARALLMEGSDEGVAGLYQWCRNHIGRRFLWLKPAIHSAGNKHEKALKGFLLFLEGGGEEVEEEGEKSKLDGIANGSQHALTSSQVDIKHVDPLVQEFIYAQIAESYCKLSQWGELQKWALQIWNKYDDSESTIVHSGIFNSYKDLSHVQALAHFDSADPVGVTTSLINTVNEVDWGRGQEWMIWKRIHDVNAVLLHSFTSTVYPHPSTSRDSIGKLVEECQDQVQWMLQLSTFSSHSAYHLRLLLLHQVLHELRSILDDSVGVGRLHEGWENANLLSLPADLIPNVSRWAKLITRLNPSVTPTSIIKLDLLSAKQARKQENLEFAQNTLIGLLGSESSTLSGAVLEIIPGAEFNPLQAKLHREAAKLLA